MLTIEMLNQNTALSNLPDAVKSAISEMSKNDESLTLNKEKQALEDEYSKSILDITGIIKNTNEENKEYTKRILSSYKSQVDSAKTVKEELTEAKKEVETLKQKLADNSADASLKQQLKDTKQQVTSLQKQLTDTQQEKGRLKETYENKLLTAKVDYAFNSAISGFTFKDSIPVSIQKVLLDSAKTELYTKGKPEFIQDAVTGKETLVFRNSEGNILSNPKNNLNPYTLEELLQETSLKEALKETHVQLGAGTGNRLNNLGPDNIMDLSLAKTQVEADRLIEKELLRNGLTRDSTDFAEQFSQLRADNNVADLPIR